MITNSAKWSFLLTLPLILALKKVLNPFYHQACPNDFHQLEDFYEVAEKVIFLGRRYKVVSTFSCSVFCIEYFYQQLLQRVKLQVPVYFLYNYMNARHSLNLRVPYACLRIKTNKQSRNTCNLQIEKRREEATLSQVHLLKSDKG